MSELTVVVAEGHGRHHVREKGYVESPRRVAALSRGVRGTRGARQVPVRRFAERHVTAVHDPALVKFLKSSCGRIEAGKYEYSYLFPVRNADRPPLEWSLAIGYYCIDTFTPIHKDAWVAAREAVDAALTGAQALLGGDQFAYALVRPPGHHAERRFFGGFCYLNSSAIAAHYLSEKGKVAMLDVDYHHGNGQQDIFWQRNDVLTVSIHGHPRIAYPYFSGYANEEGEGSGSGFNVNFPLPEKQIGRDYRKTLRKAIEIIEAYDPDYVVVPLGLDTARDDPTGSWALDVQDFFDNGRLIAALDRPTLFVQEGGYRIGALAPDIRALR